MIDNKTIYEQRYETYRHLDNLRWFIFQIAISVAAGIISLKDSVQESSLFAIGLILFLSGSLIAKINHGVDDNNIILSKVGKNIGDSSIPIPKKHYKSISWWIAFCLIATGAIILLSLLLPKLCQIACSLCINH
jgi:uncharacterized membrane protein